MEQRKIYLFFVFSLLIANGSLKADCGQPEDAAGVVAGSGLPIPPYLAELSFINYSPFPVQCDMQIRGKIRGNNASGPLQQIVSSDVATNILIEPDQVTDYTFSFKSEVERARDAWNDPNAEFFHIMEDSVINLQCSFYTTFLDICQDVNSSTQQKNTVRILKDLVSKDSCKEASTALTCKSEISLSNLNVSDLSPLKSLYNLNKLDLSGTEVSSLTDLEDLPVLEELDLSMTSVSNLTPLLGLRLLKSLNLMNSEVENIRQIADLSLNKLNIKGTFVDPEDVKWFQSKNPNCIVEYDGDMNQRSFQEWCEDGSISSEQRQTINLLRVKEGSDDILSCNEVQAYYEKVGSINLAGKNIIDPMPICSLKGVHVIQLANNKLENIECLFTHQPDIKYLDLSNNGITSIPMKPNLIEYLNLSHNKISNLNNLRLSRHIWHLDVSNNNLNDISGLIVKELFYLSVAHNQNLKSIPTGFNTADQVFYMDFHNTRISSDSLNDLFLAQTPSNRFNNLSLLNLSNIGLNHTVLPNLSKLGVHTLFLNGNPGIGLLSPLLQIENLEILLTHDTSIKDLSSLRRRSKPLTLSTSTDQYNSIPIIGPDSNIHLLWEATAEPCPVDSCKPLSRNNFLRSVTYEKGPIDEVYVRCPALEQAKSFEEIERARIHCSLPESPELTEVFGDVQRISLE